MTDNSLPSKKKIVLQPLHDDVPVAATPISNKTQPQLFEIDELRKKIDDLTNTPAVTDTIDAIRSLPLQSNQQQNLEKQASIPKQKKAAMQVVRDKLAKLYAREPDATDEAIKAFQIKNHRSKHQTFMYNLTTSGKSLAQIQTQWHEYYIALPDSEKHEVWHEFYKANQHNSSTTHTPYTPTHAKANSKHATFHNNNNDTRTAAQIKQQVVNRLSANGKLKAKHHFQSLLFGMVMASIVVVIFLFGFFNERFIAPFVSPSKRVSATPIVGSSINVGPESKIIIPKINLEVPVVYDLNTTEEKEIQAGLENGVVHYSTSAEPGQSGNIVIVGHSSNNILNKGRYKFAFVLLKRLEIGDTISLQKGGVRYTYEVYDKKIVKPNEVSVLGTTTKPNTVTLITCDPPGTSINRLVVVAEQISPDPTNNKQTAEKVPTLSSNGVLPSNAPTLWQRIKEIF